MSKAFKTGFLIAFIILAAVFILVSINSEDEQASSGGGNTAVSSQDEIPGVVIDNIEESEPVRTAAIQTDALSNVRPQELEPQSGAVTVNTQTPLPEETPEEPQKTESRTVSQIAASLGKVESVKTTMPAETVPQTVEQTENNIEIPETQAVSQKEVKEPPKADKPAKGQVIHVVESGENLSSISRAYYGTPNRWKEIQKANNIKDPSKLQIGQKLLIP
jgi:nucleoid-associated protein YgaU